MHRERTRAQLGLRRALCCHPCSALPALARTQTLTCFRKRSAWGPSCGSASRMNCITSSTVQHEGSRLLSRVPSRYRSEPGAQHMAESLMCRQQCHPRACSSTCSCASPLPSPTPSPPEAMSQMDKAHTAAPGWIRALALLGALLQRSLPQPVPISAPTCSYPWSRACPAQRCCPG